MDNGMENKKVMLVACDHRENAESLQINALGIVNPESFTSDMLDIYIVLPREFSEVVRRYVPRWDVIILQQEIDIADIEKESLRLLLEVINSLGRGSKFRRNKRHRS